MHFRSSYGRVVYRYTRLGFVFVEERKTEGRRYSHTGFQHDHEVQRPAGMPGHRQTAVLNRAWRSHRCDFVRGCLCRCATLYAPLLPNVRDCLDMCRCARIPLKRCRNIRGPSMRCTYRDVYIKREENGKDSLWMCINLWESSRTYKYRIRWTQVRKRAKGEFLCRNKSKPQNASGLIFHLENQFYKSFVYACVQDDQRGNVLRSLSFAMKKCRKILFTWFSLGKWLEHALDRRVILLKK